MYSPVLFMKITNLKHRKHYVFFKYMQIPKDILTKFKQGLMGGSKMSGEREMSGEKATK